MEMDHQAIVCFAHWPGLYHEAYADLKRIASHSPVLGRFVTLDELFEADRDDSAPFDEMASHSPDEYRSTALTKAVAEGQQRICSPSAERDDPTGPIRTLGELLTGQKTMDEDTDRLGALQRFASALPRSETTPSDGLLVVNPRSFAREMLLDTPDLKHPPKVGGAIQAAYEQDGRRQVLVEVPPLGYVSVRGKASAKWNAPSGKPLAEENLLRNAHLEVTLDPVTGAIRSVHDRNVRGNRLSQQLALRMPGKPSEPGEIWHDSSQTATYSVMSADSIEIKSAGPLVGELLCRGKLLDKQGKELARYAQTLRLARTSHVLELEIELEPLIEFGENPWESYLASRIAWNSEAVDLFRSVALGRHPTGLRRIEAPDYIDISEPRRRTTLLSGGLAYHRRVGDHMLDTLLLVRGETARAFRLGIGFELSHPHIAALEFNSEPVVYQETAAAPTPESSWLLHINTKSVIATNLESIANSDGSVRGVRFRLLETAGRPAKVALSCFRSLKEANALDFLGGQLAPLKVEADKVFIKMTSHQWSELELLWAD